MRFLKTLFVSIGLVFTQQAHAGLFKDAVRHPFLTGAAVVAAGATIAHQATKPRCGNSSSSQDGTLYSESSDSRCQAGVENVSLTDKAELVLLKSQTKALRKNLAANGEKESKGCAAHHIVPKNENRDWAKDDVKDARNVLDACNIDIDAAINGIYLPFNEDAECEGANHRRLHTLAYYAEVARRLVKASVNGCGEVEKQMGGIKDELRQNTFIGGVH